MPGKPKEQSRHSVKATKSAANTLIEEVRQYMDGSGYLSWSENEKKYVLLGTNSPRSGLADCPKCGIGRLRIVRSKLTGKRFMGCSNYLNGCTASSPLLQKARLRGTKKPCGTCGWPEVIFRYSRNQKWSRQCSNIECSSRRAAAKDAGSSTTNDVA